jgi:hypothetical protein
MPPLFRQHAPAPMLLASALCLPMHAMYPAMVRTPRHRRPCPNPRRHATIKGSNRRRPLLFPSRRRHSLSPLLFVKPVTPSTASSPRPRRPRRRQRPRRLGPGALGLVVLHDTMLGSPPFSTPSASLGAAPGPRRCAPHRDLLGLTATWSPSSSWHRTPSPHLCSTAPP